MLRTQRVFNWEEQFSIWTDVCPTITTESQQKGSHSPGCACAHHENTRMEDAGRSALVISLNARTHTHSLVLRRELRCQPFCCPVRPYSLLTTAELCYRILLCVHFPNNLELMCRPMEMCVFFCIFQSQVISMRWNNQSEPVGNICSMTICAQISFWPNSATYCLINRRMWCNLRINEIWRQEMNLLTHS